MSKTGKWTYSGIRAHCASLTYDEWLEICKSKSHYKKTPFEVVAQILAKRKR